jgi:hypothetical protein
MAAARRSKRRSSVPSKGRRGSKLSKKTNNRRNTKSGRAKMARGSFALPKGTGSDPSRNQYRMDTLAHARNARARVAQHGTTAEKRRVRAATAKKWPSLGSRRK